MSGLPAEAGGQGLVSRSCARGAISDVGTRALQELFVRGFVRVGSHFLVRWRPMHLPWTQVHRERGSAFSVEAEVLKWISEDRYAID